MVMIVDDPRQGISEGNLIAHMGDGPCKHLDGDKPGEYSCKVHSESWYDETPCFAFTQTERDVLTNCRIGEHLLNNPKKE